MATGLDSKNYKTSLTAAYKDEKVYVEGKVLRLFNKKKTNPLVGWSFCIWAYLFYKKLSDYNILILVGVVFIYDTGCLVYRASSLPSLP